MLGGLYDFFAKHQVMTQAVGLIVFILVLIGASTAISCHNCINDDSKSKEDCKGGNFGNLVNIVILVLAILMVLYHCYSLFVLLDGHSMVAKAHGMVMNQINSRRGPAPTAQQVEMAFSKAFGPKIR